LTNGIYDFKLDQWNITWENGDTFDTYVDRIAASNIWVNNLKDLSVWTLSPDGAEEINSQATCPNQVYYFSYSCQTTYNSGGFLFTGWQLPDLTTFPILGPFASWMGSYTRSSAGGTRVALDKTWWANDGVVNTNSHSNPTLGITTSTCLLGSNLDYQQASPASGVWHNTMLNGWDHLSVVGDYPLANQVGSIYNNLIPYLFNLPNNPAPSQLIHELTSNSHFTTADNNGSITPSPADMSTNITFLSQSCPNQYKYYIFYCVNATSNYTSNFTSTAIGCTQLKVAIDLRCAILGNAAFSTASVLSIPAITFLVLFTIFFSNRPFSTSTQLLHFNK